MGAGASQLLTLLPVPRPVPGPQPVLPNGQLQHTMHTKSPDCCSYWKSYWNHLKHLPMPGPLRPASVHCPKPS